jgi:hypothetical protein
MNNYAQLNEQNLVINVIVADLEFIDLLLDKENYKLLTRGGIGYTYDSNANVFIAPQPYASWTLDSNYDWQPPTPKPDGNYYWNEDTQTWVQYD